MKTLILLSSLLFSAYAFSNESLISNNIEITEERYDDYYSHYFGNVAVGRVSFVTYHVRNNGNSRLDVKRSKLMGDDTYSVNTSCLGTIFPGFSCQIIIKYAPYYVGTSSGVFELHFMQDRRVRVYVTGNGKE